MGEHGAQNMLENEGDECINRRRIKGILMVKGLWIDFSGGYNEPMHRRKFSPTHT